MSPGGRVPIALCIHCMRATNGVKDALGRALIRSGCTPSWSAPHEAQGQQYVPLSVPSLVPTTQPAGAAEVHAYAWGGLFCDAQEESNEGSAKQPVPPEPLEPPAQPRMASPCI